MSMETLMEASRYFNHINVFMLHVAFSLRHLGQLSFTSAKGKDVGVHKCSNTLPPICLGWEVCNNLACWVTASQAHIYSAPGKYSQRFTFSTFCYSLMLKSFKYIFSLINLHSIPHNDKAKTGF